VVTYCVHLGQIGGGVTTKLFKEYCDELGIRHELTAPYTPQQNGVVEKRNQTIMSTARCMMKAKQFHSMFWVEVVNCDVYLLNGTMSKSTGDKTPYEVWTGSKPTVSHLSVWLHCTCQGGKTKPKEVG
jgi:transposase InsO family protein